MCIYQIFIIIIINEHFLEHLKQILLIFQQKSLLTINSNNVIINNCIVNNVSIMYIYQSYPASVTITNLLLSNTIHTMHQYCT